MTRDKPATDYELEVLPDPDAIARTAAEAFVALSDALVKAQGRFVVALACGSTPRLTYMQLAHEPFVSRVDWSRVQVIWGDERCVPPDNASSNYKMARESLLDHVPVPASHVHRISGETDPAVAAQSYEDVLRALLSTPRGMPLSSDGHRIDLAFLGLGADAHTASVFPESAAIDERSRWVVAVEGGASASPVQRITLTVPVLNAAANVLFLVSGREKAGALMNVLEGAQRPRTFPAQLIAPERGRVRWIVDADAAAKLERNLQ